MDEEQLPEDLEKALAGVEVDEERLRVAKQQAFEMLSETTAVLGLMMALAAPRVLARLSSGEMQAMTREKLLLILDRYLAPIEAATTDDLSDSARPWRRAAIEPARRVRAHLESWAFCRDVPAPLVQAARDYFQAISLGPPAEGWDAWLPPEDEDAAAGTTND